MKLCTGEVLEDLLLGGGFFIASEIGYLHTGQHLDCGGLTDSVRSEDTGDESLLGDGEPVQAEGVLTVLVDHLLLELIGESYDLDGIELALVDTDTASLAQCLRDDGFTPFTERDTFDPCPVEGAELLAFMVAFPILASVYQNGRDPHG